MSGDLHALCGSCKHYNGMYCQYTEIGCGYEWEAKQGPSAWDSRTAPAPLDFTEPITPIVPFHIKEIDISKAKVIPMSEALKDVEPYYIGIEVPMETLYRWRDLLLESGTNTKAQVLQEIEKILKGE